MRQLGPGPGLQFLVTVVKQFTQSLVYPEPVLSRRGDRHRRQRQLEVVPEPLLALAQRFLGSLPVGDVTRQGHNEASAPLPEPLAPDLDREDCSILAAVPG